MLFCFPFLSSTRIKLSNVVHTRRARTSERYHPCCVFYILAPGVPLNDTSMPKKSVEEKKSPGKTSSGLVHVHELGALPVEGGWASVSLGKVRQVRGLPSAFSKSQSRECDFTALVLQPGTCVPQERK